MNIHVNRKLKKNNKNFKYGLKIMELINLSH